MKLNNMSTLRSTPIEANEEKRVEETTLDMLGCDAGCKERLCTMETAANFRTGSSLQSNTVHEYNY